MAARPRIALIHATPVSIDPIHQALQSGWPEAEAVNILDDSLAPDRAKTPELSPAVADRIVQLARYARSTGADGILFTCSAFGRAIEMAASLLDVPVLKPNEAMFEAAIRAGRRIAMIATFPPSVASMEAEFAAQSRALDMGARLISRLVEPAMIALRSGDAAQHNRLIAEEAARLTDVDVIMLAHFSTSRAAAAVRQAVDRPVITSPDAAVIKLRGLIGGR
jgi:Asp/Glu/hydantoin racemase